jgi:hypothetical protein
MKRLISIVWILCLWVLMTPASAQAKDKKRPFRGGMALSLHSSNPNYSYIPAVREIKKLGATDLSILVHFYQDHSVSIDPHRHAFKTPTDKVFSDTVKEAKKLGLKVMIMPILLLEKPRDDDWRGNLKPPKWDSWRAAYLKQLLHFARLAEKAGADIFSVGSELSSLEQYLKDWRDIVKQVRKVFSGLLTYSANWDHYENIGFWEDLDLMGISGYYELTESKTPKIAELKKSWTAVQTRIMKWRKSVGLTRPIIFTEIGYSSQDGCASKPWNYYLTKVVDLAEQKMCYEAFISVWDGQPQLEGVYFYEWWGEGGSKDHRYTPRGKPAELVIRNWYKLIKKRNSKLTSKKTERPDKSERNGG